MPTFVQFLQEKFYDGEPLRGSEYLELFVDPTTSELRELAHQHEGEVGAILSYNHLYVFDREHAMHSDALHLLNKTETPPNQSGPHARIPFYIYPSWTAPGEIAVLKAWFTVGKEYYGTVRQDQMTDEKFLARVKAHPAMQHFTAITLR